MVKYNDALDISVIIPTHNRDRSLARTLEAITQIDCGDLRVEFIIVDNNSNDRTLEVVESYVDRLNIRYLFESRQGKNCAINHALCQVPLGKLVVFADDDIIPDRLWLIELFKATQRWPDDCIFGSKIVPEFPPQTPEWICDPNFSYTTVAYSRYHPREEEGYVSLAPFGCSFAIRREIFQFFTFNENIGPSVNKKYIMGSETELLNRLQQANYRFVFVQNSRVKHIIRSEQIKVEWLLKRAYKYGKSRSFINPPICNKLFILVKLFIKVIIAWLFYIFSIIAPEPIKFKFGSQFYFLQGHFWQLSSIYRQETLSFFIKNLDIERKEVVSEV